MRPGQQAVVPLPGDLINESPLFSVNSLDFANALHIKGVMSQNKCYILLFTCPIIRAIHVELYSEGNCSVELYSATAKFLLTFRRFIYRSGLCAIIVSDSAKTFKRAELKFKEI